MSYIPSHLNNPKLRQAISELNEDCCSETIGRFLEEFLQSTLLVPTSELLPDDVTRLDRERVHLEYGASIPLIILEDEQGNAIVPAFTDREALLMSLPQGCHCLALEASDLLFLVNQGETAALVVNPHGPESAEIKREDIERLVEFISELGDIDDDDELLPPGAQLDPPASINSQIRAAITCFAEDPSALNREALHRHIVDSVLFIAVSEVPQGMDPGKWHTVNEPIAVRYRTAEGPDGSHVLLAFTDMEALKTRYPDGHPSLGFQARRILSWVLEQRLGGVVLNPAGPWIYISATDIEQMLALSEADVASAQNDPSEDELESVAVVEEEIEDEASPPKKVRFKRRRRRYPLPKFLEVPFMGFAEIVSLNEIERLCLEIEARVSQLGKVSDLTLFTPDPTLVAQLAECSRTLLNIYSDASDAQKELIIGAVRYFICDDEGIKDADPMSRLDDDISIMNYVLEELGIHNRFIVLDN